MLIKPYLESILDKKIVSLKSLPGGSVSEINLITLENGLPIVVKSNPLNPDVFVKEQRGLNLLSKSIRVPKVLHADEKVLILEAIKRSAPSHGFFEKFGSKLALLHQSNQSEKFGLNEDNYIGLTIQKNTIHQSWAHFYWENRILYLLKELSKKGSLSNDLKDALLKTEKNIKTILHSSSEPPTLIHGDLWSGNFLVDEENEPVLIDPAVYFGHREAELSMTFLFGGFERSFYDSYEAVYPLKSGWRERLGIYQLYHILNHLLMFGKSYEPQALELCKLYR